LGRNKTISDDQLLRHAREVFLESGAFGSTKEIARRAGISEATLFQRYPTKAALFLAAMIPPKIDVNRIVNAPTTQKRLPGALTEIGVRMLAYFRTLIPAVMHLIAHPSISMTDVKAHFQSVPEKVLADALADYLREAAEKRQAHVANPFGAASLMVSAIHSLAVFELMEMHRGQNLEHAVDMFVQALWSGLAPARTANQASPRNRKLKLENAE
jgi:AcrR family transcriptional regulator